jgi:16S rRNA (guanine966-N2)-methyltransferase|tara:strand:- start:398 stop:970 length:573 start_codon:yes stop_codon:yes gene_type:complete
MRIIGGKFKGKKLFFLNSKVTRPLRDRVKENLFNIIKHSNLIDVSIKNSSVLDLYSGIGSFGLECVSREAKKVTFVEENKNVLEVLNKNVILINKSKNKASINIYPGKIKTFFKNIKKNYKFDIIFFDPPFLDKEFIDHLYFFKKQGLYSKKHLVILHRESNAADNLKIIINVIKEKKYGRSKIIIGKFN